MVSSDGEKASAAWRRTLDGTERRVHHQEERGGDANLVDRAHVTPALHGRRHAHFLLSCVRFCFPPAGVLVWWAKSVSTYLRGRCRLALKNVPGDFEVHTRLAWPLSIILFDLALF